MCLGVKKHKVKNGWLFVRINYKKQCTRKFFRGWNASSKVRPIYLDVLKHEENYGWCFWRLNDIEKSSNVNEVIRAVLNLFTKRFYTYKKHKALTIEQKQKRQYFYVPKKHLRGRKSLIRLFAFLCFLVFLCFLCFLCFLYFLCFYLVASLCFSYFLCFLCFLCFLWFLCFLCFLCFLFFLTFFLLCTLFMLFMLFVLFVLAKSFCRKSKRFKTALMTSFTLLLNWSYY